jgi:GT2 family glycosyltransferase
LIVYVVAIGSEDRYRSCARVGITRVARPQDRVVELRDVRCLARSYNRALDGASDDPTLEAVVLLHDDTEIISPRFLAALGPALALPSVGVIGAVGASDVTSLSWWEGRCRGLLRERRGLLQYDPTLGDVEAVDGSILVMSPLAARTLRFDARVAPAFHGYDVDICFQARTSGLRVVTTDLHVFHHTKGGYGDKAAWLRADRRWRRKWRRGESLPTRLRHVGRRVRVRLS